MKCYTFADGFIRKGISAQRNNELDFTVSLGEKGRGRWHERVGPYRKNPAKVKNGRIHDAHPVKVTFHSGTAQERSSYALANPKNPNDPRVVVRVWAYTGFPEREGKWEKVQGDPVALVRANGAEYNSWIGNSWDDDLILMSPGDMISVYGSALGQWIIDFSDAKAGPIAIDRRDWDREVLVEDQKKAGKPIPDGRKYRAENTGLIENPIMADALRNAGLR